MNNLVFPGLLCLALVGCGGGTESTATITTPFTLTGTAARGAAISAGTVNAKCSDGTATTTTAANGSFTLIFNAGQTLPCMLQVTKAGVTPLELYSFASSSGNVNLTPLTDLALTKALAASPAVAYSSFDATEAAAIATGLSAAIAYLQTQLSAAAQGTLPADLMNLSFVVGDANDKLLDNIALALLAAGKSYADLVAAVKTSADLSTVLPVSSAGTGTTGGPAGCTGDVAAFFAANAKTYAGVAGTYDATPSGRPTVLGFVNGATYPVTVNGNCTITVGTYTLTYVDKTFFSVGQYDADVAGAGVAHGHYEKFSDGTSLLGLNDPATTNGIGFSMP